MRSVSALACVAVLAATAAAAAVAGAAPAPSPAAAGLPQELSGRAVVTGRHLWLVLPPGAVAEPATRQLAEALDAAVAEMAPRVPVRLERPLLVAVEASYPDLARATNRLAAVVPGGAADLHLVYHPDDLFAYRHAVARWLLGHAGLAGERPPWLVQGAALWLSGEWFGRPWRDWLPRLAAAGALPTAAELLAGEVQGDGSAPLWTPAAAAVVAGLAGDTVAVKLRRTPGAPAVTALLAAAAGAPPPPFPRPPPPVFLRGVSLAMLNRVDGGYHAPSVDAALDRLAGLGADAVALMPFAYQPDPRRPEMAFLNRHPASETDAGLIHAARRARAAGFRVLWKPHLWISFDSWPGEVEMSSEEDWRLWWSSYRRYVLHHALLAAWTGADVFCIGVELDRTLGREAEWRALIAGVRQLYPGPLTYAANWYGGAERVGFWDALDLAGVDAYFPLSAAPGAGGDELAAGARAVRDRLAAVAAAAGRPLLLTEVGFAARRAAWVEPHGEGGDYSEADQAAAYRALLDALGRPRWLAGLFVWKAFSAPRGRSDRPDFRFLDRRAESEIRRYFLPPPATGGTPAGGGDGGG